MKELQQCTKIFLGSQYNLKPLFTRAYYAFIPKFAAAAKKLKTNYVFFIKPKWFLLIPGTGRSMANF